MLILAAPNPIAFQSIRLRRDKFNKLSIEFDLRLVLAERIADLQKQGGLR
ncbi:hypothetical protein [Leptolyngbya sp. FACHB-17]|nr:hypothetical protein [Leptolyngbya sp. FACHB-17]MBD2079327.1 hypothetical protein [Leptolyngbya sp. FACHB-17]